MRIVHGTPVLLAVLSLLTLAGCGSGHDHVGGVVAEPASTIGDTELVVQPTEKLVTSVWECTLASLNERTKSVFVPSPFDFKSKVEITVSSQDEDKQTLLFESAHYDLTLISNKGELSFGTWKKPDAKSPNDYTLVAESFVNGSATIFSSSLMYPLELDEGVSSSIRCEKKSSSEEPVFTTKVEDMKFFCSGSIFGKKKRDRDSGEVEFGHRFDNRSFEDEDSKFVNKKTLFRNKEFRISVHSYSSGSLLFLELETKNGEPIFSTTVDAETQTFGFNVNNEIVDASLRCERNP